MKKDYSDKTTEYGKVLAFDNNPKRYLSLTEKHAEKDDLLGALSFAISGLNKKFSLDAITDIADLYADMGLYNLSNRYWYKYMVKAPKEKLSLAYEELAINYFYLGNFALSGYYFHLKITEDGYISRDNLDNEIVEFFDKISADKSKYRIVYPESSVDYKLVLKDAKRAIMMGDYVGASKKYAEVPSTATEYKTAREGLSLCLFLSGNDEEALKENKAFIEEFGPTSSIYCNLSEIYRIKEDKEKSAYYYKQAIEYDENVDETSFKLASCAIEHADYKNAVKYFDRVIDDKIYDVDILLLYGMALINSGDYERAQQIYSKAYRIDPLNTVSAYYAKLSLRLLNGEISFSGYPVLSAHELPIEEVKARVDKIKKVYNGSKEGFSLALKDKKFLSVLRWGITEGEPDVAENCIRILVLSESPVAKEMISEFLLDTKISDRLKEGMLFVSVLSGVKSRINLNVGGFFIKVKPGKPLCEKDPAGILYFASYALAFSRMAAAGAENLDKILRATDNIFIKMRDKALPDGIKREDVASLIVAESGLKYITNRSDACGLFGSKPHILDELYKIYLGE